MVTHPLTVRVNYKHWSHILIAQLVVIVITVVIAHGTLSNC